MRINNQSRTKRARHGHGDNASPCCIDGRYQPKSRTCMLHEQCSRAWEGTGAKEYAHAAESAGRHGMCDQTLNGKQQRSQTGKHSQGLLV